MLGIDHPAVDGVGIVDGPAHRDSYKRAVHRPPPRRFMVSMLEPTLQGSDYSFGIKISPMLAGDRSSISSTDSGKSSSTSNRNQEYEIWRRWEDCLWFQQSLELEYSRMARMKRTRLMKGKGVKKNGFYKQDMASSWESLPPGPDPSSVAPDIHYFLPRLTKKGTLFKASQAMINQRQAELKAFVMALFQPDAPALFDELRDDRIVTDFFGYWRRDHDLAQKAKKAQEKVEKQKEKEKILKSRSSMASFFTPMPLTLQTPPDEGYASSTGSSTLKGSKPSFSPRRRPAKASTAPSGRSSFGDISERPMSSLESLPEDAESDNTLYEVNGRLAVPQRGAKKSNRSMSIFGSPLSRSVDFDDPTTVEKSRGPRESWQTTASASTYLDGLGLTLPDAAGSRLSVSSVNSVATFMTQMSADAVIPRNEILGDDKTPTASTMNLKRTLTIGSSRRKRRGVSVMSVTDSGGDWSDGDESTIVESPFNYDSFPLPAFHLPSSLIRRPTQEIPSDVASLHQSEHEQVPASRPETPIAFPTSTPEPLATEEEAEDSVDLKRPLTTIMMSPTTTRHFVPSVIQGKAAATVTQSERATESDERKDRPPTTIIVSPVTTRDLLSSTIFESDNDDVQTPESDGPPPPSSRTIVMSPRQVVPPAIKINTDVPEVEDPPSPSSSVPDSDTLFEPRATPVPTSPATSVSSFPSVSPLPENITIKAAFHHTIVMVRVPSSLRFLEVKERVKDRLLREDEDIRLSESFVLATTPSAPLKPLILGTRFRTNSLAGLGGAQMRLIVRQADWDKALDGMVTDGASKISVRVLDSLSQ